MVMSVVLGAAGLLSSIITFILSRIKISSFEKDAGEWAQEVISGYFKDVLPAFAVILLVLILSAVFQPKMRTMRIVVIFLSSVLCLIFGEITSFLAQNGNVSVTKYVYAESVSFSFIIHFCSFFDYRNLYLKLCGEKKKKEKNKKKKNFTFI